MPPDIHDDHEAPAARVRRGTGVNVDRCYQCGKCSAGCPLGEETDLRPSAILRMLQVGTPALEDRVLRSEAIWLCLSCETCAERCPQEVDLPQIMDHLRAESRRQGKVHPRAVDVLDFHRSFLASIRAGGRLHEVGLIAGYKLRSFHLFQDVLLAPKLMARGKLSLLGERIEGRDDVARLIDHATKTKEPS